MGLKLVTPATGLAVSLEIAKAHLRIAGSNSDDNEYVTNLIRAATKSVEQAIGRSLGSQVYRLTLSDWPESGEIVLPFPPLVSVQSIQYVDTAGVNQTLAANQYIVNDDNEPATITPAHEVEWPEVQAQANAVQINYTAGYTTVPEPIQQAMLLLMGHWYENREAVVTGTIATDLPLAVDYLLEDYTIRRYRLP